MIDGLTPRLDQLSGGRDSARQKSVADAVASHEDLASPTRNVGPGVGVAVAIPCDDRPDRAIVRITYTTDAEWEGVDAILRRAEGFGAPIELASG